MESPYSQFPPFHKAISLAPLHQQCDRAAIDMNFGNVFLTCAVFRHDRSRIYEVLRGWGLSAIVLYLLNIGEPS